MDRDPQSRPPTLNFLDPVQRSRLLKSSRKLGHILGATPHVLESVDGRGNKQRTLTLKTPNHHHPARLQLSPISDTDVQKKQLDNLPSPLPVSVRIPHRARSPSADDEDASSLSFPSPSSSTSTASRKQMAKLTRVLGENIPPELVLRSHHHSRSDPTTPEFRRLSPGGGTRKRSSSYSPNRVVTPSSNGPSSPTPAEEKKKEKNDAASSGGGSPSSVGSITYPLLSADQRDSSVQWTNVKGAQN